MISTPSSLESSSSPCWFVGALMEKEDHLEKFLQGGYWEHGFEDKYLDLVRSMRIGERIAIKAAYTRKQNLPFESWSNTTSVMAIKAIGVIEENSGNGKRIEVRWQRIDPIREWYFYTYQRTLWKVTPGEWKNDALIDFTFNNQPQDIDRFRNDPFWLDRYATDPTKLKRFQWTRFYQAIADELIKYKNNRLALIGLLKSISSKIDALGFLSSDTFPDGSRGFIKDIDPFTFMGIFNRQIKESTRKDIAAELANFFGVTESIPESFEGVPVLNNVRSWFFPWNKELPDDHIDKLWEMFESALQLADGEDENLIEEFSNQFDIATSLYGVSWNLSFGFYWIRPWNFLNLDGPNRSYIEDKLRLKIGKSGPKKICNSKEYLLLTNTLKQRFEESDFSAHSFPELSFNAWNNNLSSSSDDETKEIKTPVENIDIEPIKLIKPYSIENILEEGSFLSKESLTSILSSFREKKNLILQGPPGTGKTWLARRLGKALIGEDVQEPQLRSVQFHPNLSYEDFVRGWRPGSDGKLNLHEGIFMQMVNEALEKPSAPHILVIEEINRGNPAQIFGELLTLLESSKRSPKDAMQLCYPDQNGKHLPVYIPANFYVIGTMNIADRSLALVDMAFRRRFAFINLEPTFNKSWREFVVNKLHMEAEVADHIQDRMNKLNNQISTDNRLGKDFKVGHSYVTPNESLKGKNSRDWFSKIVKSEIKPLLEEYWFESNDLSTKEAEKLLEDL